MKKAKINEIIQKKVINKLLDKFIDNGFKLKKSNNSFFRIDSEFFHEVFIAKDYDLYMMYDSEIENPNDIFISFKMFFSTEFFEFEKWYATNFPSNDQLRLDTFHKEFEFCILVKEGIDFNITEDFSEKSKEYVGEDARLVKVLPNNIYQFESWGMIDEIPDFDSNIDEIYKSLNEMISTKYDLIQLYNSTSKFDTNELNSDYLKYNALLIYNNQLDFPAKFFTQTCNELIDQINSATSDFEKNILLESLITYISLSEKHLNLKIKNPFA